jgi:hypothetical protein
MTTKLDYTVRVDDEADRIYSIFREAQRHRERREARVRLAWWAAAGLFTVACWTGVLFVLGRP